MTNSATKLAARYTVGKGAKGRLFILTHLSARIVSYVTNNPDQSYAQTSLDLDIPINSLMVYAQRLEMAGLVKRRKLIEGTRTYTGLRMAQKVKIDCNVKRI